MSADDMERVVADLMLDHIIPPPGVPFSAVMANAKQAILTALRAARASGIARGREEMRERCRMYHIQQSNRAALDASFSRCVPEDLARWHRVAAGAIAALPLDDKEKPDAKSEPPPA